MIPAHPMLGTPEPMTKEEWHLARIIFDELTNNAMGRGLHLHGSHHFDDARWTVDVLGNLDLTALARRLLKAVALNVE